MTTNRTNLEYKIEGVENSWPWKFRVLFILEEAWLGEEAAYPGGDEDKVQKGLSKNKEDYFRLWHWIWHVSSLKTPKDTFDSMDSFYEEKNINKKMILRMQLKDIKM